MSINLTLNCLVIGENPYENTFPVVINTSEVNTIGLLKELIKEKQPRTFANVDSKELKLWKVDIPLNKLSVVNAKFNANNKDEFLGVKQLSPLDEISEDFANQPPKKHLHLIIQQECEFGVNQASGDDVKKDSSRMNKVQINNNVNESNRCESGFSIATISIQSMVSTTTSLPRQSMFSWMHEKFQNLFKKKDEEASEEDMDDVLKNLSASRPTTNANGTNLCETRFSIVNYCQQYMVNTNTE